MSQTGTLSPSELKPTKRDCQNQARSPPGDTSHLLSVTGRVKLIVKVDRLKKLYKKKTPGRVITSFLVKNTPALMQKPGRY